MTELADRLRSVRQRIDVSTSAHGRSTHEITLIVVTKFHPAQLVLDLLDLGVSDFGENRDQEAKPKAQQVAQLLEDRPTPNWHFVGQLQSNKVRSALSYAGTIHSLDRLSLLKELIRVEASADAFIELNLTGDPGRGGVAPAELTSFAEQVLSTSKLNLLGVMGVAALDRDPRFDFETIAQSSQLLQSLQPAAKFISAGMSGDFEEAIGFGATHLRIGTAITGNRAGVA